MKTYKLFLASWLILFTSCSNPTKEFKNATITNTIEAYENFITKYPGDSLAVDAKFQICSLKDSIFEYESFVNEYPISIHVEQANKSIKKLLGVINGRLIDKNTNEPLNIVPFLFRIYDENTTDKQIELIDKIGEKFRLNVNIENNGNFNIENVIPGQYALFINNPVPKSTGKIFNIEASEILDLGDVPVNFKK